MARPSHIPYRPAPSSSSSSHTKQYLTPFNLSSIPARTETPPPSISALQAVSHRTREESETPSSLPTTATSTSTSTIHPDPNRRGTVSALAGLEKMKLEKEEGEISDEEDEVVAMSSSWKKETRRVTERRASPVKGANVAVRSYNAISGASGVDVAVRARVEVAKTESKGKERARPLNGDLSSDGTVLRGRVEPAQTSSKGKERAHPPTAPKSAIQAAIRPVRPVQPIQLAATAPAFTPRNPSPVRSLTPRSVPPVIVRPPQPALPKPVPPTAPRAAQAQLQPPLSAPSPSPLPSAPAGISSTEAREYMDIIKNLLYEGFDPDSLVKRGATPKYVTAVCEEIVEGTKRRKALWAGAKDTIAVNGNGHAGESTWGESSSAGLPGTTSILRPEGSGNLKRSGPLLVPRAEIPVRASDPVPPLTYTVERSGSISSEGMAEDLLMDIDETSSSPEVRSIPMPIPIREIAAPPVPPRLPPNSIPPTSRYTPSSSWTPPVQAVVPVKPTSQSSSQGVRIESYKPTTLPPSEPLLIPRASLPSYIPSGPSRRTAQTAPVHPPTSQSFPPTTNGQSPKSRVFPKGMSAPTKPSSASASARHGGKYSYLDGRSAAEPIVVLDYGADNDDDDVVPLDTPRLAHKRPRLDSQPVKPSRQTSLTPSATVGPVVISPTPSETELATKQALLETRQKVLESMRRRRAAPKAVEIKSSEAEVKMEVDSPDVPTPTVEDGRSIEQEVADLEQEVLGLQADMDMDIDEEITDEPEEGEITPLPATSALPTPPNIPISLPTVPTYAASLPIRAGSRGIKRPNAEDMDGRPLSAPVRARKRVFGGGPQKPMRLIINLDNLSDDGEEREEDEGEEEEDEEEKRRLLNEKEEKIRALRAQIARRIMEKKKKLQDSNNLGSERGSEMGSPAPSGGLNYEVVRDLVEEVVGDETVGEMEKRELMEDVTEAAGGTAEGEDGAYMARTSTEGSGVMDVDAKPLALASESIIQVVASPPPSEEVPPISASLSIFHDTLEPTVEQPQPQAILFKEYHSLLYRYPQLPHPSLLSGVLPQVGDPLSATTSSRLAPSGLDKHLLSSIILTHRLQQEPTALICPSEAGGGRCADKQCEHLHLDKLMVPTDEDLSEYLIQTTTRPLEIDNVLSAIGAARMEERRRPLKGKGKGKTAALDASHTTIEGIEEIIARAGIALGLSSSPPS